MSKTSDKSASGGQFLVYQTQDGKLKIDVRFEGETVWLTQQQMAELFTGQTAAEIVHGRVDAAKPNLGLTSWRGPTIRKQDVAVAKNYRG